MELSRKSPRIKLAAVLLVGAATSTPVSADPSQQRMGAVQAAVREMRDEVQARQQQQPRAQYMHRQSHVSRAPNRRPAIKNF
jgi:hypothetical protein